MKPTSFFQSHIAFLHRISSQILGLAILAAPIAVSAQVTYTGAAATENFGQQSIGSPTPAAVFTFSVGSGTKVGSIAVLTTGVANMDFANAAGTTCTPQAYAAASSCTVSVAFTPAVAGPRMGAVVFYSKANNLGTVLGSVALYGTGMGPQIAYGPGIVSAVDRTIRNARGLSDPVAVTADAAGNLFILDTVSNPLAYTLVRIPAGGGAPITTAPAVNGEALYLPSCIAVDGAGNIYIGDFARRVVKIPTGGGAATALQPTVNGIALNYPSGLAIDGAGDLFISDYFNNRVLEIPASGAAPIAINPTVNGIALNDPHGLALDGSGTLYIADLGNSRIVSVPANGAPATAIMPVADGMALHNPIAVAVNAAGDLYIADHNNHRVVKVQNTTGAATGIDPPLYVSGIGAVYGVALSSVGDLFIIQSGLQSGSNIVEEIQYSQPPVLDFPTPATVGSIDSVDGLDTLQVVNIGNQPLTLTAIAYPTDFSDANSDPAACLVSTTLNAGAECSFAVEFDPQSGVSLSESLTLAYQAPSGATQQQAIALTGIAYGAAAMISPSASGTLSGSAVTFTWTAGFGATRYSIWVGTSGPGSSALYALSNTTATSTTLQNIPARGATVYVRLYSLINRVWQYRDYTYTESSTPAALTSPSQGTLLGTKTTFQWSAGSGVTSYELQLGSIAAGSSNLYDSGQINATYAAFSGLPSNGATLYVRLISTINGIQSVADYTYQAATQAVLISPTPNSTIPGGAESFAWSAGSGVSSYQLWLGTSGPGSSSLYNSGVIKSTSATAPALPAKGVTIYARLFSMIAGVSQYTDYTYIESAGVSSAAKAAALQGGR